MSTLLLGLRYFFIDLIGGVLRWPIWWYTRGLALIVRWAGEAVSGYSRTLAIRIWIKNIFVPMFGMYDWQSRIISFFMRVAQIIGRSIALVVVVMVAIGGVVVYVTILPLAVGYTVFHFLGALVT